MGNPAEHEELSRLFPSSAPLPSPLSAAGFGQHTGSLCPSFLLILFLSFPVLSPMGCSCARKNLLQCGPPWAAGAIPASCAAGDLCPIMAAPPPVFSPLSSRCSSHFFPSWPRQNFALSWRHSQRVPAAWLRGWGCGAVAEPGGTGHVQPGAAPGLPSPGLPRCAHLAPETKYLGKSGEIHRFYSSATRLYCSSFTLGQNTVSFCLSCHKPEVNAVWCALGNPAALALAPFCESGPCFWCSWVSTTWKSDSVCVLAASVIFS